METKEQRMEKKPMRIFVSSPYRPTAEDEETRKSQLASNIRETRKPFKKTNLWR